MTDRLVCFSGGAVGADLTWGDHARAAGFDVIHFSFQGHKKIDSEGVLKLPQEMLDHADTTLAKVNELVLKRTFPTSSLHTNNLLRRNYWQAAFSEAIYATAGIDGNSVFGGTAWAIEIFKEIKPGKPIYIYDESHDSWFEWMGIGWGKMLGGGIPPMPTTNWAGIGSRYKFSDKSVTAIAEVLGQLDK